MSEQGFAVYVVVGNQKVRVGTAYKEGDGFAVSLGGLRIGSTPDAPAPRAASGSFGGGGGAFPNYGRSKGQPIAGAPLKELEYYAANARKSIADPSKARWKEKEEALLAQLEAEIARQGGGGYEPPRNDGPVDDEDPIPF